MIEVIEPAKKMRRRPPPARERKRRQHGERRKHDPGRFMNVCLLRVKSRRAMKGHKKKPKHVECGKARRDHAQRIDRGIGIGSGACREKDFLFAEKTGEARRARDRQRGHEHGAVGPWDGLAQSAHAAHILLATRGMHHAARAEKQQGLEKSVSHQVKDSGSEGAYATRQKHVSQLADGGIGERSLDIGLHQRDGGGEKSGGAADHGDGEHG